jgi:RNA polymerase sigma factor (sigma-70 family)
MDCARPDMGTRDEPEMALVQRIFFGQRPVPLAQNASRMGALIDRHADAIYRTARRLGVPERDIQDVAQDVLVVLVRRQSDIDLDKAHAFVVGSTIRVVANWRRRRRRRAEELMDDFDESAAALPGAERSAAHGELRVEHGQLLEILQSALAQMTEAQRAAFVLFELEECSAKETADALGVSEATVVSRVRRAREVVWKLRERRAGIDAAHEREVRADGVEP